MKRVVIAGGTGFIGSALSETLISRGYAVAVLSRSKTGGEDRKAYMKWDGRTLGDWAQWLDGADAVVNLAGKSINTRHTEESLNAILASRVDSINIIAQAIGRATKPPRVWVNSSAVGIYGDTKNAILDEDSIGGKGGLVDLCKKWEAAFAAVDTPNTRKVLFRLGGVVLGNGGALPILTKLTKLFLGGSVGNGRQWMSWIHIRDAVNMIVWAIENDSVRGIYNGTAPNPKTNAEFMATMRKVLKRPWSPPAPPFAVAFGAGLLGTEASLLLEGNRVIPKRAQEQGFAFQFPELEGALKDLLN
jgi:hypothetical protein